MCGIVGVLDRSGAPVPHQTLQRMTGAIVHRGPDGEGHFAEGPVGLGNRRLAVIDPTPAGSQPMHGAENRLVITYNGEIYNFRELRSELQQAGHRFRTATDTEVVLNAYAEWGPDCVTRFNGMFAFAIWDRRSQELFLARDRYGIKPLYYATADDRFLFASEIKALLAHGDLRPRVSATHLLQYFTFQNVFTDGTMFAGVHLLPAGHRLTLPARPAGGRRREPQPERYWEFQFGEPDEHVSDGEYLEELVRLVRQAVTRQLVADVDVGAELSGGMDSGAVTAIAAERLPYLSTFTIGFDMTSSVGLELGFDERVKAEAMSYLFKTEHYEAVLKAGDMERCLPALVWHLEDLRLGPSYPNYYASRLASRFVTVCLTGSGGDELFAGYPWRYCWAIANDGFDDFLASYYRFWNRLVPESELPSFFRSGLWSQINDVHPMEIFRAALPNGSLPSSPADYVNRSLHLEAKTFLHALLIVADKLSMAHSLEQRLPFLDNDLVDFAQRVPVRLKLRDLDHVASLNGNGSRPHLRRTSDGKLLLREAMKRYVPLGIAEQVKQGFSGPDGSWFRGDSIDYVRRVLMSSDAALYEFLEPEGVHRLVTEHLEGRENRRLLLWSLLSFEHWCRTFLPGAAA